MEPRISLITLGVTDLERATRFYQNCLGLPRIETPPTVTFFELGTTWLALWSRDSLAADAGVPGDGAGFRGFALAHNVRSPRWMRCWRMSPATAPRSPNPARRPTGAATRDTSPTPTASCGRSRTTRASRMSELHPVLSPAT